MNAVLFLFVVATAVIAYAIGHNRRTPEPKRFGLAQAKMSEKLADTKDKIDAVLATIVGLGYTVTVKEDVAVLASQYNSAIVRRVDERTDNEAEIARLAARNAELVAANLKDDQRTAEIVATAARWAR